MTAHRTLNVSPSVLADVITCETKAWLRHVKGYTSRGDAIKAVAGQAFHLGVAEYLDPYSWATMPGRTTAALAALHAVYDPAYARLAPEQLEPALVPANLHKILARWIEMHPPALLPWAQVLRVEVGLVSREWNMGTLAESDGENTIATLIVRPDAIVLDANGAVRFVDTKTTGWRVADPGWRRALRLSLQVSLYTDAVQQLYGATHPTAGGWINAVEIRALPKDPSRVCKEHHLVYAECGNEHAKMEFIEAPRPEENVAAAVREAERAAHTFAWLQTVEDPQTLRMQGASNGACRFCPAADWCDAGRPLHPGTLDSLFVYDPWVVEPGKRPPRGIETEAEDGA